MADHTHPARVREDPDAIARGRRRDELADAIEIRRRDWHGARTRVDTASRELRDAIRGQVLAELEYRAAVAAYEAEK